MRLEFGQNVPDNTINFVSQLVNSLMLKIVHGTLFHQTLFLCFV